jgi:hypothetical protein
MGFFLALGILVALWGEAWLLRQFLVWVVWHTASGSYWHAMSLRAFGSLVPAAATWITIGILAGVILATHALRLCLGWSPGDGPSMPAKIPPPPAAASATRLEDRPIAIGSAAFVPDGGVSDTA